MFSANLTQRTNTATGYTLSGKTSAGYLVTNFYNTAGVLLEQDVVLSANQLIKYFTQANGSYFQDIFINGKLTLEGSYSSAGRLLTEKKYALDGVTLKEVDAYNYTAAGLISSKVRANPNGSLIETVGFTYTEKNALDKLIHTNPNGVVTQIDYFVKGVLDHIEKPTISPAPAPAPAPILSPTYTTPVIPTTITTTPPTWNNINGYGEINLIKALGLATGAPIKDVAPAIKLDWGITSAHFDDAWSAGYTGKGIVIANIDTGIDLNNKALTHNLSQYNWNFISNNSNVQDDNGHGSFTAGELIASNTNNGVVGACYDAELMVLKALDSKGSGSAANIAKAIVYAVDHGADVINMSLGSVLPQPALKTALQYATDHDVMVSIASGNNMGNSPTFPAAYAKTLSNVVSVGACMQINSKLNFAAFSNKTGSNTAYNYVDAPGAFIQGYDKAGKVISQTGTSMAAPYVAAEMAILKQAFESLFPSLKNTDIDQYVIDAITHATDSIGLTGVSPIPASYFA